MRRALIQVAPLACFACLFFGCDDGSSGEGGGGAFDCERFAAAQCDPACACREGPACAMNTGGRSAIVFSSREECMGFYMPTCDFVVSQGGGAQLAAEFESCREDLPAAECTDDDGARTLIMPESCRSGS